MILRWVVGAALLLSTVHCADPQHARPNAAPARIQAASHLIDSGYFSCFGSGTLNPDSRPAFCEPSTVVFDGQNIFAANDKDTPPTPSGELRSSVFVLRYTRTLSEFPERYLTDTIFRLPEKFEASTLTEDGTWTLLSTAFDRAQSSPQERHNTVLAWPTGHPEQAQVVNGSENSAALRPKIREALRSEEFPEGPAYFKIEGLTAIPDHTLLFGVREIGDTHQSFRYVTQIIAADYHVDAMGKFVIDADTFRPFYAFDAHAHEKLQSTVGLSSIEYHRPSGQVYILTSYENSNSLGAYVWRIPLNAMRAGAPLQLMHDVNGEPIMLTHKAEGMTFITSDKLLVICDDDRVLDHREPQQAAYYVLEID